MEPIFLSQFNSELDRHLVIEGDEFAVWAYILNSAEDNIEIDGFLCSRGLILDALKEVETYIEKGMAPPLSKEYANEFSIHAELETEDITVAWEADSVFILIKGEEYLELDLTEKKSYSKAIAMAGPYGEPYPVD